QIKPVGREADHTKKKNDRDNSDQNVGNDQPIAQAPQQMIAYPGHEPDDEINRGDEAEKKKQPREWEAHIRKGEETGNQIENKYGQCDAVEGRKEPEENENT